MINFFLILTLTRLAAPGPFPRLNEQRLTHVHAQRVADAAHNIAYVRMHVVYRFSLFSLVAPGARRAASFENIKNGNILRDAPSENKGEARSERRTLGINILPIEQCALDARRFCIIFRYGAIRLWYLN